MNYQILVRMPTEDTWETFPSDVLEELKYLTAESPSSKAPGSIEVDGYKIVYAKLFYTKDNFLDYLEGMIQSNDLDWEIFGLQTIEEFPVYNSDGELEEYKPNVLKYIDMLTVGKFIPSRYSEYDENGKPVGDPITPQALWIAHYQGASKWVSE